MHSSNMSISHEPVVYYDHLYCNWCPMIELFLCIFHSTSAFIIPTKFIWHPNLPQPLCFIQNCQVFTYPAKSNGFYIYIQRAPPQFKSLPTCFLCNAIFSTISVPAFFFPVLNFCDMHIFLSSCDGFIIYISLVGWGSLWFSFQMRYFLGFG